MWDKDNDLPGPRAGGRRATRPRSGLAAVLNVFCPGKGPRGQKTPSERRTPVVLMSRNSSSLWAPILGWQDLPVKMHRGKKREKKKKDTELCGRQPPGRRDMGTPYPPLAMLGPLASRCGRHAALDAGDGGIPGLPASFLAFPLPMVSPSSPPSSAPTRPVLPPALVPPDVLTAPSSPADKSLQLWGHSNPHEALRGKTEQGCAGTQGFGEKPRDLLTSGLTPAHIPPTDLKPTGGVC